MIRHFVNELFALASMRPRLDPKQWRLGKYAAVLALLASSFPPAWCEPAHLSEQELLAMEKSGKKWQPADFDRLRNLSTIQFSLAFQGAEDALATHSGANENAVSSTSGGGGPNAADNVRAVHAVAIGGHNLNHNPLDTKLMLASIALSIVESFKPKQVSDSVLIENNWRKIRKDSFFLVYLARRTEDTSAAEQVDRAFAQGTELIRTIGVDCAPAAEAVKPKSGQPEPPGEYTRGQRHVRLYVCRHLDASVTHDEAKPDYAIVMAQRIAEGADYANGIYATVELVRLSERKDLVKLLASNGPAPVSLGRAVYERTKNALPTGWLAIFGERPESTPYRVTVGSASREISLDLPEPPRKLEVLDKPSSPASSPEAQMSLR